MSFGIGQADKTVNFFLPELFEIGPLFVALALVNGFISLRLCLACLVAKLNVELHQCFVHDLFICEQLPQQSGTVLAILEAHVTHLDWLLLVKGCIKHLLHCLHVLPVMLGLGVHFLWMFQVLWMWGELCSHACR